MSRVFTGTGNLLGKGHMPTRPSNNPEGVGISFFAWMKPTNTENLVNWRAESSVPGSFFHVTFQYLGGSVRAGSIRTVGNPRWATITTPENFFDTWYPLVYILRASSDFRPQNSYTKDDLVGTQGNGQQVAENSDVLDTLMVGRSRDISTGALGNYATGKVAHIALWNRELTPEEVTALVTGTATPASMPADLLEYWPMTDGNTGDEIGTVQSTVLAVVDTVGSDANDNPPVGNPTAPNVTSVNGDNTIQSNGPITINGTFPAPITTVDCGGYALNITGQTGELVTCSPFDAHDSPLGYTAHTLTVTNGEAESDNIQVTLQPGSGTVVVTGANVDTTYGLAQAGGADGDTWETPEGSGNSSIALLPDTNMVFTPAVPNGFTSPYWRYSGGAWIESSYQVNGGGTQPIAPTYSNQTSTTYEQVSVDLSAGWFNVNPDGFGVSRLPSGLSMSPQGLVTGTVANVQTVTGIIVNNSGVNSNAFDWTVTLGPAIPPDYTTRRVYIGLPYFNSLANGWLNTDGSAFTVDLLPAGLTMDAAGLVTGTPTTEQEVNSVVSHRGVSSNPFAWIVTEAPPTGSLVDAKWNALRGAGYTGAISDMMLQWLQAAGAISGHVSDAWLEMLAVQGYGPGQRNDLWYQLLGDMGYTGSLPDRELAFWLDGGVLPGVAPAGPETLESFLMSEGWTVARSVTVFTVTEGVHEWVFTWHEAEDGVYADDIPASLRSDIDDYFGR